MVLQLEVQRDQSQQGMARQQKKRIGIIHQPGPAQWQHRGHSKRFGNPVPTTQKVDLHCLEIPDIPFFFFVFIFNKRRLQETVRPQVHSRTNQRDLKSPPLEPQTLITIRKYPHYIETHETLGITIYNVTLHFAPYTTLPPHIHIPPYPSISFPSALIQAFHQWRELPSFDYSLGLAKGPPLVRERWALEIASCGISLAGWNSQN